MINLLLGDCLEELKNIPDNSIDLVLTDPAYESMMRWQGIGTTARMGMGKKGTGSDNLAEKWFDIFSNDNLPILIQEIYRVLKTGRIAYILCDWETLRLIHKFAIEENVFKSGKPLIIEYENANDEFEYLKYWTRKWLTDYTSLILNSPKTPDIDKCTEELLVHIGSVIDTTTSVPLIWNKVIQGTGYTYRSCHEYIFMLWKGKKRKLNNLSIPDVLRFKKPWGKERVYPTQKPVGLFELLINQSTFENEIVLDMFMGSGTTAKACLKTNRNFIGIEKSVRAYQIACNEIEKLKYETPLRLW